MPSRCRVGATGLVRAVAQCAAGIGQGAVPRVWLFSSSSPAGMLCCLSLGAPVGCGDGSLARCLDTGTGCMFGPLGVALLYAFPSGVSVRVCSRVSRVDASGRARGMEQMASLCSTLQKALPATPLPATPAGPTTLRSHRHRANVPFPHLCSRRCWFRLLDDIRSNCHGDVM